MTFHADFGLRSDQNYRDALREIKTNFDKFKESVGMEMSDLKQRSSENISKLAREQEQLQNTLSHSEESRNAAKSQAEILDKRASALELELKKQKQETYSLQKQIKDLEHEKELLHQRSNAKIEESQSALKSEVEKLTEKLHLATSEIEHAKTLKAKAKAETEQQVNELRRVTSVNLDNVQNRVNFLTEEREQMMKNHQCQLEQLQESFKERLRQADKFPQKMIEQERSFEMEKGKLQEQYESKLKEQKKNFEQMLSQKNEKYEETIQDMSIKLKSAQTELKVEMSGLVEKHKQVAQELAESLAQEKKARLVDTNNLLEKIKEIEREHAAGKSISQEKNRQHENELRTLRAEITRLQNALSKKESEIEFLQTTVHKECDERKELIEALKKARSQALLTKAQNSSHELKQLVAHKTASSPESHSTLPSLTAAGVGGMMGPNTKGSRSSISGNSMLRGGNRRR